MKILLYSDIHISKDSSIVKKYEGKYTTRLNHIIDSIDWAENLATEQGCEMVFNLGDTFDKPIVNSIEATAVQDIKWNNLPHYVLVGNHDSDVASLEYSSVAILKKLNFKIIDKPFEEKIGGINVLFLPYITQSDRKPLSDYITNKDCITLVISHNDIAGFNFGGFISQDGFSIEEINENCNLFLNGHLHNSDWLNEKILNVGNLCGQNFTEDAFKYKHCAWVLDTNTLKVECFENPFSFNFYKLIIDKNHKLNDYKLQNNSVLMIRCENNYVEELKEDLANRTDIIASRILIFYDETNNETINNLIDNELFEKMNHLKRFSEFILSKLDNTEIVKQELAEILK